MYIGFIAEPVRDVVVNAEARSVFLMTSQSHVTIVRTYRSTKPTIPSISTFSARVIEIAITKFTIYHWRITPIVTRNTPRLTQFTSPSFLAFSTTGSVFAFLTVYRTLCTLSVPPSASIETIKAISTMAVIATSFTFVWTRIARSILKVISWFTFFTGACDGVASIFFTVSATSVSTVRPIITRLTSQTVDPFCNINMKQY